MKLTDQPAAVQQLLRHVDGSNRYVQKPLKTRIQLLLDGEILGGWADDQGNGKHWYMLENPYTLGLNLKFRSILKSCEFCRKRQVIKGRERHYWLAKGPECTGQFKQAVEEITGIAIC